jgi:hypothetical protein
MELDPLECLSTIPETQQTGKLFSFEKDRTLKTFLKEYEKGWNEMTKYMLEEAGDLCPAECLSTIPETQQTRKLFSFEEDQILKIFLKEYEKDGNEITEYMLEEAGDLCPAECHFPAPKKQRTRKLFSFGEDQTLRTLVEKYGENWEKIAEHMPGKTPQQLYERWKTKYHSPVPKTRPVERNFFSFKEDQTLRTLVEKYGENWDEIVQHMPGRTKRQLRERWGNYLSPNISNTGKFTREEDEMIIQKRQKIGSCWTKISRFFSGRSVASLKNRWYYLRRHSENYRRNIYP